MPWLRLALIVPLAVALLLAACAPSGDKLDKKPGAMPDAGPPPAATSPARR